MYEIKTKETDNNVMLFINGIDKVEKREDAIRLLDIFSETTGLKPKIWGASMIGFGSYHYKYASGHEGDAMITGFSPRKAKISLYFTTSENVREELLQKLGKHTAGKGCIYVNKLADIEESVLKEFIKQNIKFICDNYPENSISNSAI